MLCFLGQSSVYTQSLRDLEDATVGVASKVGEAVVSISSVVTEKVTDRFNFGSPFSDLDDDPFRNFFEEFFGEGIEREYKRMGLGSGVIIDREGYILTNEHVVSGASQIKVKLSDGREFDAQIKGSDPRTDLAVIKIEAKNLTSAKLGDSKDLKIGQWVVAIGNPFGFAIENPEPTVTVGVVSALHRYLPGIGKRDRGYDDLIQTDAAINPGNSGGPLVNLKGEIVGINTAIITTSGGYQGLGFATPISKAKRILRRLIKGEKVLYGWLGVNIQDLNDDLRSYFGIKEREGVIVLKVYKDSPAQEGGLNEGDLILAFNKQSVRATRELVKMVSSAEVGETIALKVVRSGKEVSLKVKIGATPGDPIEPDTLKADGQTTFRGMIVENITSLHKSTFKLRTDKGVVITDIRPSSSADKSGLVVGDVIVKIENKKISNKNDFRTAISKVKGSCLIKTSQGYFVLK
tara:strand:- start:182 stop:1567 length:1386 start_codon:yes stop_codon:yes gene_type:complete